MQKFVVLKFELHDYKRLANLLTLHQNLIAMTGITKIEVVDEKTRNTLSGIINGSVKDTLLGDIKRIRIILENAERKER